MLKSKLVKTLIVCICLIMLSSGAALAKSGGGVSPASSGQQTSIDSELLKKQQEIDSYLFEQHKDDISQRSFSVTHTGVVDNYVEIGITPYSEENANYLYEIFGKDKVKVVEGVQATTMEISTTSVTTTSAENTEAAKSDAGIPNTLIFSLVGIGLLGGVLLVVKKYAHR